MLQEVTVAQLQDVTLRMNAQFHNLSLDSRAVVQVLNHSQVALHDTLGNLKTALRKTQRQSHKTDTRLQALGAALNWSKGQQAQEQEAQREALSSLALNVRDQQAMLAQLLHLVQSQGAKLAALGLLLQGTGPGTAVPPSSPPLSIPEPPQGKETLSAPPEPGVHPQDFTDHLGATQAPISLRSQSPRPPENHEKSKCPISPASHMRTPASVSPNLVFGMNTHS